MDPVTTAALIGAGTQLAGSIFGGKGMSNKEAFTKMQEQAYISRQEIVPRMQEYTKMGIHPLIAAGGASFTPSAVVPSDRPNTADHLASAGQNIGRAVAAYQTSDERAMTKAHNTLTLENMALQNDLLRSQITSIHTPTNPALPNASSLYAIPGQGDARLTGFDSSGGSDASVSLSRSGNLAVVPSESVKNRIEDMLIPEVQWYLRQAMADAPKGYAYNPLTSELFPINEKSTRGSLARGWRNLKHAVRSDLNKWR